MLLQSNLLEVTDPLKVVDLWTGRQVTKWIVASFFCSLLLAIVQAWADPLTYTSICKTTFIGGKNNVPSTSRGYIIVALEGIVNDIEQQQNKRFCREYATNMNQHEPT